MADENGKAQVAPTGIGIEGSIVLPPWWDDPAEQGRETVRLLNVIAGELSTMNVKLAGFENLALQRIQSSPLAGLLRGGRPR